MLDSALPPCFPVNNSGVSWLIPIRHSNRTFRFTSNIIQFSFNSPHPHPTKHRGILTNPTQRFQEDFSIHLQRYSTFEHFAPFSNPSEHRGFLTTPTQRFQEDFSIHLQRYSIFFHFAPFSNPSEHRGFLTTPSQQFRSIFGLVPPLSLRRGSISNLRSSIGVVTGIMFQKALWNSPPNLGAFTAPCNKQNKSLRVTESSL